MSFPGHFNCLSDRHPAAACSFCGILTAIVRVSCAFALSKESLTFIGPEDNTFYQCHVSILFCSC